jgi:hypothetical protein
METYTIVTWLVVVALDDVPSSRSVTWLDDAVIEALRQLSISLPSIFPSLSNITPSPSVSSVEKYNNLSSTSSNKVNDETVDASDCLRLNPSIILDFSCLVSSDGNIWMLGRVSSREG